MHRRRLAGVLDQLYDNLQESALEDLSSTDTSARLLQLTVESLEFLRTRCNTVALTSRVRDKEYLSYVTEETPDALSRPINVELFEPDQTTITRYWRAWIDGETAEERVMGRLTYTMAMAYCAAIDLFDRGNKKGPATYFEYLVGHLFARAFGVNPAKKATIPGLGKPVRMTMDFVFDLERVKVHLAVKMSTRERVVQAWAHQRLLDAAYGVGHYRGLLVCFAETKLDLRRREVVEICVPDQWLAYQTLLARMERIYYFDVPQRYAQLAQDFPIIQLKQFGQFFAEKEEVLGAPGA